MSDSRSEFLDAFIRMFEGQSLEICCETPEVIEGVVHFEDESGRQEIRWHCTPDDVPSPDCRALVDFIGSQSLLDIDCICLPRPAFLEAFQRITGSSWEWQRFVNALGELEEIWVAMIDDGKENDAFFVHE